MYIPGLVWAWQNNFFLGHSLHVQIAYALTRIGMLICFGQLCKLFLILVCLGLSCLYETMNDLYLCFMLIVHLLMLEKQLQKQYFLLDG